MNADARAALDLLGFGVAETASGARVLRLELPAGELLLTHRGGLPTGLRDAVRAGYYMDGQMREERCWPSLAAALVSLYGTRAGEPLPESLRAAEGVARETATR